MKFEERETQNPTRKRLYKINQETGEQLPFEESVLVDIEPEEGDVLNQHFGTPISAENLNKGNWRDDESLSFRNRSETGMPAGIINTTQIVTADDGKTYLIKENGSTTEISGDSQAKSTLDFVYPFTAGQFTLSDNDKYKDGQTNCITTGYATMKRKCGAVKSIYFTKKDTAKDG